MWQNNIAATSWAFVWIGIVSLTFFMLKANALPNWLSGRIPQRAKYALPLVLLTAVIVRFVPMLILPVGAGYDIESYKLVAKALTAGEEVYTSAAVGRHPYLPMQMVWLGAAWTLAQQTIFPFVVWVKLLPVLVDVAITAVIFFVVTRLGKTVKDAVLLSLFYALNPVAILVSAYHGQFDAIPLLLMLLSWAFYYFGQRLGFSALALGFAVLNKTWPVVMLPIMLIRLRRLREWILYTAVTLFIPFIFTIAYIVYFQSDPKPMLMRAFTHTGPIGYWGPTAVLAVLNKYTAVFQPVYDAIFTYRRWFLIGVGIIALWRTRDQGVLSALTTTILAVLAVSAGMGIQWLLWIVPFAILIRDIRWLKVYTLTSVILLLTQLYGFHMVPWLWKLFDAEVADSIFRLGSIPAWLCVISWAAYRLFKLPEYNDPPI